jgi:site-specific recombinase XerD
MSSTRTPSFAATIQEFFTDYLVRQRALSPNTVAAYRDAFTLFLRFAEQRLRKPPTEFQLADLDQHLLAEFLDHLEQARTNSVRTRNARLAAVRSFLKFAARRDLAGLHRIEQALAVPMKRFDRPMLGFLSREQMLAVMDVPGNSWLAERDRLLLRLLYNTGARVSELIRVRVGDVILTAAPCVHLQGKGRKERSVPLWNTTTTTIAAWLRRNSHPPSDSPLIPTRSGTPMTRANVAQRLHRAVQAASEQRPELVTLSVSPHTIRHTTAMHLLQSGVDASVIALWLGHESPTTTHMYVEADLSMKESALSRLQEPAAKAARYRAPDRLLRFLQAL